MRRRFGIAGFISIVQTVLFLTHYFLYQTWTFSAPGAGSLWIKLTLGGLSVSFVAASLFAFRYTNPALRAFYRGAAVWLGLLTFLFVAAVASWAIFGVAAIAGVRLNFHRMVEWSFGTGLALGIAGVINASWTRITRATIRLANLPQAWRGRKAALISDVHLGHVRNGNFLRRMVSMILEEGPDAIFIAGDLYDGTFIDARKAAEPLSQLTAPHGVYFVAGNHEQFGDDSKYLQAVKAAGVRVLHNEKVEADGLQIVGVPYNHATRSEHLASALKSVRLDRERASILLLHAPDHPEVAEAAGVSLQLSGHTHLGQFVPWSWFARKIYRQFVYGLSRIGKMQVFTSSGAGTWGPPLRLGSNPEIVMLQFE
ncbi:MAG TPA: metallophosphoesterase [Candidatus Solibacter sp.]|nr:metallophosphoesterase [Candidatus Solibacter sp.]